MKRRSPWDTYVDAVTNASWRGDNSHAGKYVKVLLSALSESAQHNTLDTRLVDALYRISDFYTFEREYARAESVCKLILDVQTEVLGANDPHIVDTVARIARLSHMRKQAPVRFHIAV